MSVAAPLWFWKFLKKYSKFWIFFANFESCGGNDGGGELRRDGLTSHTSQHYQLIMEIIEYKEMGKNSDMILVQRLSKLQCNCFYVSLFIRNVVGKKI